MLEPANSSSLPALDQELGLDELQLAEELARRLQISDQVHMISIGISNASGARCMVMPALSSRSVLKTCVCLCRPSFWTLELTLNLQGSSVR